MINLKFEKPGWISFCWIVLAYVLLSALVIGANPFAGETSAPMDLLGKYPGWASHHFTSTPTHPERSDIIDVFIPQWITLKKAIRANEFGLWNPVSLNGVPGVLDVSRATFTPSFLAFLLIDEHWLGFYFSGLLRLVIAAVGAFLFLRLFVGVFPAFFGGAVFAYSGFNAAWFYWSHVTTSSWIPWLLWACAGWYLFRDKKWIFLMVFTTAMLVLGGFPVVAAYGLYASALFAVIFCAYERTGLKNATYSIGIMFISIGIAFLMVAIPLLALLDALDLIDLSHRKGGTALDFPKDLALFVDPNLYGLPKVEKTLYVGKLALVLSCLSIFLFITKVFCQKNRLLFLFGFLLMLFSMIIAFGLLPRELILLIPAIGKNPWSRLLVMMDIAVVILAAIALDYVIIQVNLLRKKVKVTILAVLSIGAVYQIYDQSILFRQFNNIAIQQDFFPSTPAINYVKDNLKGNQSVVADQSFIVSGTLGAYGIPEWFAHGFRTNHEKNNLSQMVSNPFRSPTAAVFSSGDIRFESDLFSKLGVRYVLIKNAKDGIVVRSQPQGPNIFAAPPMPKNTLAQVFYIEKPISVSAASILLATYRAKQAPSDVLLEVVGPKGEIMAKALMEAGAIHDNQYAIFRFERNIELLPGSYQLRLRLVDHHAKGQLTAWYTRDPINKGDLIQINDKKVPGAMLYKLHNKDILPYEQNHWRTYTEIDEEISVIENINVPESAYFVKNLEPNAMWSEKNIYAKRLNSETVTVNYAGHEDGYVVLPIRWFSGWVVYQNGEKKTPEQYLGMLLAVKVDGATEIKFSYEPTYFGIGLVLTILGVFGLTILILLLAKFLVKKQGEELSVSLFK